MQMQQGLGTTLSLERGRGTVGQIRVCKFQHIICFSIFCTPIIFEYINNSFVVFLIRVSIKQGAKWDVMEGNGVMDLVDTENAVQGEKRKQQKEGVVVSQYMSKFFSLCLESMRLMMDILR